MAQHNDSASQIDTNVSMSESTPKDLRDHCQQELQECKDKFIRLSADFENFKRRQEKEKLQWSKIAQAEVFKGVLDIVDNFERALQSSSSETEEYKTLFAGFDLIYKELLKFLQIHGVEPIPDQATFDPEIHEAIATIENPEVSSHSIAQVFQKGYRFKGALLRPAKVSIVQ